MTKNISKIHLLGLLALFSCCAQASEQAQNVRFVISESEINAGLQVEKYYNISKGFLSERWAILSKSTTDVSFSELHAKVQKNENPEIRLGSAIGPVCRVMQPQPAYNDIMRWYWEGSRNDVTTKKLSVSRAGIFWII